MPDPRVTVVIPVFNHAPFIGEAVRSVLAQTFSSWHLIIVDDGSTDGFIDAIAPFYSHENIRVLSQSHKGPSSARNRGIDGYQGEFIAFLDADDYWAPEKLARQVEALDTHVSWGGVATEVHFVDESGSPLNGPQWDPMEGDHLSRNLLLRNVIPGSASSMMVRRDLCARLGGFDENLRACEDQDLWFRLSLEASIGLLPEPWTVIRQHPSNTQRNGRLMAEGYLQFYRKVAHHPSPEVVGWALEMRKSVFRRIAKYYRGGGCPVRAAWWQMRSLMKG